MSGACEGGKPNRITGVGSGRGLGGEVLEGGIEVNKEGVMSGGGEGATTVSMITTIRGLGGVHWGASGLVKGEDRAWSYTDADGGKSSSSRLVLDLPSSL